MTHALNIGFYHSYIAGGRGISATEDGARSLLGHLLRSSGLATAIDTYLNLVFSGFFLLAHARLKEVAAISRPEFSSFHLLMYGGGPKRFMLVIKHAVIKAV